MTWRSDLERSTACRSPCARPRNSPPVRFGVPPRCTQCGRIPMMEARRLRVTAGHLLAFLCLYSLPAAAQEPTWSFRFGAGELITDDHSASLDAHTRVTLAGTARVLSIDAIHKLDCCLEVYLSALVPH